MTDTQAVSAEGRFLVTPRWSPSGDRLLLSGWRGEGLHALDTATGTVRELDWHSRVAARWDALGQVEPDTARLEGDSSVLFDRDGLRILHRLRDGMLEATSRLNSTQLAPGGAWGPRVSPDGTRVAYCSGHLMTGRLHVVEVGAAQVFEGAGVHPAWMPDGTALIYAVPEPDVQANGAIGLGGSDLYLLSAPAWTPIRLTDTPEVQEMEPAISPGGERVAFSDWKTGTLLLARMADKTGAR